MNYFIILNMIILYNMYNNNNNFSNQLFNIKKTNLLEKEKEKEKEKSIINNIEITKNPKIIYPNKTKNMKPIKI